MFSSVRRTFVGSSDLDETGWCSLSHTRPGLRNDYIEMTSVAVPCARDMSLDVRLSTWGIQILAVIVFPAVNGDRL